MPPSISCCRSLTRLPAARLALKRERLRLWLRLCLLLGLGSFLREAQLAQASDFLGERGALLFPLRDDRVIELLALRERRLGLASRLGISLRVSHDRSPTVLFAS